MKLKILLFATFLFHSATAFSQMVGELEDDERIVAGTLPNGLSYYLVNNSSIEGYADFTFIRKTGIAMEDSTTDGMTYLMECMALTETSNFPDGEIFTFIDNMGLDRAEGLVIDGGDYYTTYRFSDVPVKKNEFMVDSMLLAIYNMSSALIVDDRSVTRGKNFFRNVFSAAETLEQRVRDSLARYYFAGTSLAPARFDKIFKAVNGYTTGDVREFYRTRCRPDLQAVVIAGDIDPAAVESKIRTLFQLVPRPTEPAPEFPDSLLNAVGGGFFYFQDLEADCARVTFDYMLRPIDKTLRRTAIPFIYEYLSSVGVDIMRRRFHDALDDAPFYARSVEVGIEPFLNSSALRFSVECAPEDYVRAYEYILTEVERLLRYGVSDYEYRRSSGDYLMTLDRTYRRRSWLDNRYYSDLCRANFVDGYLMAGVELKKSYIEAAMEKMDSTDVYQFLASVLSDRDCRTVVCTSPVKTAGLEYFTVDPLPVMQDTVFSAAVADLPLKREELRDIPHRKFVNPSTGVTSRRLPNGAVLAYRRMTQDPGRVYFEAVARGGVSLAEDGLDVLRHYVNDVADMSVVGGMDMYDRNKLADILQLELSRNISVGERRIAGSFPTGSEMQFLELVSMYFRGSESDAETFGKYRRMVSGCRPYSMRSPERVFENLHMRDVRSGYGSRTEVPPIDSLDYTSALDFVNSLFSNPGEFSFIFVGDFDEQALLEAAYSTLAVLPGRSVNQRQEENRTFFIASYDDEEVVSVPMGFPRRLHSCRLTIPSALSMDDRVLSEITARVIEREVIRRLSLRGILADAQQRFYRYPEEVLTIDFHFTTYEDIPDMGSIFTDILDDLAERGVSSNEVDGVRRNILLSDALMEKVDYDYWTRVMRSRYIDRKDFYTRRKSALEAVTADQVCMALRQVLDKGRISLLSVVPEEQEQ